MTGRLVFTLSAALALLAPSVARSAPPSRYALAGGCYRLAAASGATLQDRVRVQASGLGHVLLYRADKKYIASVSLELGALKQPDERADWSVSPPSPDGTFALSPGSGATPGEMAAVRFIPATGCAEYPDITPDASGTPAKGDTPYGEVKGVIDGHMHWMSYMAFGGNLHCGKPWSEYGVEYALGDCRGVEGLGGLRSPLQNFLNYHFPWRVHGTGGYPAFKSWGNRNLTYEGTYWRWVERAWMAGERLMVMTITDNRELCELQQKLRKAVGFKRDSSVKCDEMATARRSIDAIHDLQRYVDAQAGGEGKGFFQIVTDPYTARRVINRGKLAVVLEIELSEPFGCRGADPSKCTEESVRRGLDDLEARGVRSALLVNKYDNPLSGVRPDSGLNYAFVGMGNRASSGHDWTLGLCAGAAWDVRDPITLKSAVPRGLDELLKLAGLGGLVVKPAKGQCNTRGLSGVGRFAISQLVERHMIVNADHMSQRSIDQTLWMLEQRGYSGVISPHSWMDARNWPRIWKLGGMAFPAHADAAKFVQEWRDIRPRQTPYLLGWGFGADLGGMSTQPAAPKKSFPLYPFKSLDGSVTFQAEKRGKGVFDYLRTGVANYGMYADWLADLKRTSEGLTRDLLKGAEAYLEMWERADGVPGPACAPRDTAFTAGGLGGIHLDASWDRLLRDAGQPAQRSRAWTWCVEGGGDDVAVLGESGAVELVASTGSGRSAGGIRIGARPGWADGLRVFGRHFVAEVRDGEVVALGVARPWLLDDTARLREAMARAVHAPPADAPPAFEQNPDHVSGERLIANEMLDDTALVAAKAPPGLPAGVALLCGLR